VVDLAIAAGALIVCMIAAITLTRLRRRARSAKLAATGTVGRLGHGGGHARHARGQAESPTAPVPARVVLWPATPTADGSDSAPAPFPVVRSAGAYRRAQPTGHPPWQPAAPPKGPGALPDMLPAQPEEDTAGESLAPWEQSPAAFGVPPVVEEPAPWPITNTGPMYVWNPAAATGPLNVVNDDEE
jgi:hypothetical protein